MSLIYGHTAPKHAKKYLFRLLFAIICTISIDEIRKKWYIYCVRDTPCNLPSKFGMGIPSINFYSVTVNDRDRKAAFCGGKAAFHFPCGFYMRQAPEIYAQQSGRNMKGMVLVQTTSKALLYTDMT